MPEGAILYDRAYFDKPEWLNQAKEGGFSRGSAWVDLLALTNQKATTGFVRGIQMPLERSQCAYSKLGLATRWGRSQSWVSSTLAMWEKDGRIRVVKSDNETTIIQVVNFDAWQTGLLSMLTPEREQNANKSRADGEQIETEKEKEKDKDREPRGEGEGLPPRLYPLVEALKHFGSDSGYTPDQVQEQWLYYDAMRNPETGDWQKPRGATGAMVRITDPRSELAQALMRFAEKKKRGATGGPSASVRLIALEDELRELENQVNQDRQCNQPRDAKKMARLRDLRATISELSKP